VDDAVYDGDGDYIVSCATSRLSDCLETEGVRMARLVASIPARVAALEAIEAHAVDDMARTGTATWSAVMVIIHDIARCALGAHEDGQ